MKLHTQKRRCKPYVIIGSEANMYDEEMVAPSVRIDVEHDIQISR